MKKEEFQALTNAIIQAEGDTGKISTALADLTTGFDKVSAEKTDLENKLSEMTKTNESLKEANYNLFLKVSNTGSNNNITNTTTVQQNEVKSDFSSLFDENGNIK